jgi:hypothetical protein
VCGRSAAQAVDGGQNGGAAAATRIRICGGGDLVEGPGAAARQRLGQPGYAL